MAEEYQEISEALIAGDIENVKALTRKTLDAGSAPGEILGKGLLPGMDVVGQRFKVGDMFIPEVLRSAKCMHDAMDLLRPLLSQSEQDGIGKVVIGTVQGDVHDIGKNLVCMMLEGSGFKVVDLGIDVKPETFIEAVKEHQPDIVGMSALLTTTMPKMSETIKAIEEAGLRSQVKIMAGGAPVTQKFIDEIGADSYGSNAAVVVEKARRLLQE
jgi:corrinoid protein of di/trimethylamine methyltransferase